MKLPLKLVVELSPPPDTGMDEAVEFIAGQVLYGYSVGRAREQYGLLMRHFAEQLQSVDRLFMHCLYELQWLAPILRNYRNYHCGVTVCRYDRASSSLLVVIDHLPLSGDDDWYAPDELLAQPTDWPVADYGEDDEPFV